jgi:hypothetical protein
VTSGRHDCTDRKVEPAVGESFVVMFKEQVAPDPSREHDSTAPCPLGSSRAPDLAGMTIGFARQRGSLRVQDLLPECRFAEIAAVY